MKIVVLLSAGRHPVAGTAVVPRLEAQAIRLAAGLGSVVGLHAGPDLAAVKDSLGQGLDRIEHLALFEHDDPVAGLAGRLAEMGPDLILAGRRSQGGDESGLVPYAVARALGIPLVADVVAIAPGQGSGRLRVDQSLGRGALRRIEVEGPVLVTVHPDAPPPLPYAYGQARRGIVAPVAAVAASDLSAHVDAPEERPYRRRPKLVKGAPAGGSAAERLKAATGEASASGGGRLLVDPDPDDAAREILAYLRQIGVLASPGSTAGR